MADQFSQYRMPLLNAIKWRALADRKIEYLIKLHQSGRQDLYYAEEQLLTEMGEAQRVRDLWDQLLKQEQERTRPPINKTGVA